MGQKLDFNIEDAGLSRLMVVTLSTQVETLREQSQQKDY